MIPHSDPDATPEARALLDRIAAVPAGQLLSGQHNAPRDGSDFTAASIELTGREPVLWGQDLGFSGPGDLDGVEYREAVIDEALRQHAGGSIVTLMWHAVPPDEDEPVTFDGSVCAGPLDEAAWEALLTDGTALHARWCAQVDVIAGFLRRLRDARVPVLWRQYHEMNGDWFWWGGRPGPGGSAALWRRLRSRLLDVHGLHNLVWVWNANPPRADAGPYADFYPGGDVVDVLAADVYGGDYRQQHHDGLRDLADGRPIALGEIGEVPQDPEVFAQQPHWSWFMVWRTFVTFENAPGAVQRLYASPRVLSRPAP